MQQEEQRLLRIVAAFPLPSNAPEAAMVGSSLRDKFTMAENEEMLKSLVRSRHCTCHGLA